MSPTQSAANALDPLSVKPTLEETEKLKYTSACCDRLSTACYAVGLIGPAVAFMYGSVPFPDSITPAVCAMIFWSMAGIALHEAGHRALGGLRYDE